MLMVLSEVLIFAIAPMFTIAVCSKIASEFSTHVCKLLLMEDPLKECLLISPDGWLAMLASSLMF